MKILFTLLFTLFSLAAFSQAFNNNNYVYLIPFKKGEAITCNVDYGQKEEKVKDYQLKDSSGNPVEFFSLGSVMNYMDKQGFDFVETHAMIGSNPVTGYLFRKRKQ